jgi:predicted RNase H-like nuclease (RuvC/YqgF family)
MIWKLISGFCVATVLTQALIVVVLATRGNFDGDSAVKMVALANGIDITGNRLQKMLDNSRNQELPSYEEVLEKRAEEGLDMELRLKAQENYYEQLQVMLRDLQDKEQRFDTRRNSFNEKLDEMEKGIRDEGMRELQRTLEVLDPAKAKTQLLMMFDEGEMDKIVNIVQAMSPEKRKRIFNEFEDPDEEKKMGEILRRIGEGEPKKSIIEQARNAG